MSKIIGKKDMQYYCRCCFKKLIGDKSLSISKMPRSLFQLFRYCTGFRAWQKGIGYPEQVCEQCEELLKSFENFGKLCKKTAYMLDELLNGHKVINQEEFGTQNEEATEKTSYQPQGNDKNQRISFENIEVKAEIAAENIPAINVNTDSDAEDALALPKFIVEDSDADIKSEKSCIDMEFESIEKAPSLRDQSKTKLNCEVCGKVFSTSSRLENHIEKVHVEKILKDLNERESIVEYTEQVIGFGSTELEKDSKAKRSTFEDLPYENSAEELSTMEALIQTQTDSEDLEDTLTLNELVVRSNAKRAVNTQKSKVKPKHSKAENVEDEEFVAHKIDKAKVACEQCPRKFKWPFELRRHLKEMHGDKPLELRCKFDCGKIFHSQNTLKSHYRINHQMKKQIYRENAYICEQCGKGFKRLPLLERHRFHHMPVEARPYKCEQCGKAFVMERIYKEHLLRHSGDKKFECNYCGIKKATIGEYREHINIHTKEKEYACELCPKIFYRSKNLVQHVSAVHQGIKKHFCRYCQHSFANHINLVHHERIHTGEKPYTCEICKRSFIQPSALKTHMKTHDETRVKAKVGRKPKNKSKEEFIYEAIVDNNVDQQQINNYNE